MNQTIQSKRDHLRWTIRQNELNKEFAKKRIFEEHHNESIIDLEQLVNELTNQQDESKLLCSLNEAILASKSRFSTILQKLVQSLQVPRSQIIILRILKLVNRAICQDDSAFVQIQNILEILQPYVTLNLSNDLVEVILLLLTNLIKDEVELVSEAANRTEFLANLCQHLKNDTETGIPQACIQFIHALVTRSDIKCVELVQMFFSIFSKQLAVLYPYDTAITAQKIIQISKQHNIAIQNIPSFIKLYSYATMFIMEDQVNNDYKFIKQYWAKFLFEYARSFINKSTIEQAILFGILEIALILIKMTGQMRIYGLSILISLQKIQKNILEQTVILKGNNYPLKVVIIQSLANQTQTLAVSLILELLVYYMNECQEFIFQCFMYVCDANILIIYLNYFRTNFRLLKLSRPVKLRLEQLTYDKNVDIAVLSTNILTNFLDN